MDTGDMPSEAAPAPTTRSVAVSFERLPGWIERFDARHAGPSWQIGPTRVTATTADGALASFDVPFGPLRAGSLEELTAHLRRPWQVGIVVVRRGGFAVAHLIGPDTAAMKVGRRHVQGRSKAGGWSQQRFARRRANQAQAAFEAAGEYVEQLLLPHADSLDLLASGGDRRAVDTVLGAPSLARLTRLPRRDLTVSGDPGRAVLDRAVAEVRSVRIEVVDPLRSGG